MENFGIILFTIIFFSLTWKRFHWGLFFFFLLLPTYLLRFQIGSVPSTILEIMILCLVGTYILKERIYFFSWVKNLFKTQKLLFFGILLFFIGATLGLFVATDLQKGLGEWKAFYIEPLLFFFVITAYVSQQEKKKNIIENYILLPLLICGIGTSILAIYQHFTGWMVPHAFWANRHTYRVTGWYGFPNAVGLFLAPLFVFAWYFLQEKWKNPQKKSVSGIISLLFILTAPFALLFAKGSGPILGMLVGFGFLFFLLKKTRVFIITLGILGFLTLVFAPLPSTLKQELFFQDRSGQIRVSMWKETKNLLSDSPIFGAGMASYDEKIIPYHTLVNGEKIEIFHHPHNIFLTLWVNTGIIGLAGFFCILLWCFIQVYKHTQPAGWSTQGSTKSTLGLSAFVLSGVITILVMGLVDSPYIKNDLAIVFWIFPALIILGGKNL